MNRRLAGGGYLEILFSDQVLMSKFNVPMSDYENGFDKVEGLKKLYQQNLAELENLYKSLSQKAFKGELNLSNIPTEKIDSNNNIEESTVSVLPSVEIAV